MPPSHRLTISIPAALAERLEGAKESIVVSNVCAEAIEKAVSAHEVLRDQPSLAQAVARLRAQRIEWRNDRRERAYRSGWSWVMEEATYDEIAQLFVYNQHTQDPDFRIFKYMRDLDTPDAQSMAFECSALNVLATLLERFCRAMSYDADGDEDFRVSHHEWETHYTAFLDGIEAAWKAVRDEVMREA